MKDGDDRYNKALHTLLGGVLCVLSWLMIELYGNIRGDIDELDGDIEGLDGEIIRAADVSRGADESISRYLLEIERRLDRLED